MKNFLIKITSTKLQRAQKNKKKTKPVCVVSAPQDGSLRKVPKQLEMRFWTAGDIYKKNKKTKKNIIYILKKH